MDTIAHGPVKGGRRQGHVKGNIVVPGGQRLEIGADLVGHVAGIRGAVGSHDHHVHPPMLHEVAAGVVRNHRVGHPLLAQFPGGQP